MASDSPTSSPTLNDNAASSSTDQYINDPRLSTLEASVLTEYALLLQNLNELAKSLGELAAVPSSNVADGLRMLERKTALVCTALKSSVYGIVLQQQIEGFESDSHGNGRGNDDGLGL